MIPLVEIKERAVAEGVPETIINIEDYMLSWILKTLFNVSEAFVLEGGTGKGSIHRRL